MNISKLIFSGVACSTMLLASTGLEQKVIELENKLDAISSSIALGSSASKLSFGGYAKVDYTNYLDVNGKDKTDNYRLILAPKYEFTDSLRFIAEIEFEHAGTGLEVEQSYIQWDLNDNLSLNMGAQIIPMGLVNLHHEPTVFNGVGRPETEKYVVPSTWYENAIVLRGSYDKVKFSAGILPSLNINKGNKIRDWRSKGAKSKTEDLGIVARVDFSATPELLVGASYFTGDIGQNVVDGAKIDMLNLYTTYSINDLSIKALYAQNDITKDSTTASEKSKGFYVDAGYKIGDFVPFIRYEKYNAYDKTATIAANKKENKLTTIGVNYFINPNVVLKADYVKYDKKGTDDDRFELGIGMMF